MRNDELMHYGVLGMKWGHRKYQNKDGTLTPSGRKRYRPTSIRSWNARRHNKRVDKSFKKWEKEDALKKKAIESGLERNKAKMTYELNRTRDNKKAYKDLNKTYKKNLRKNTTYRKGDIKRDVGRDLSKKYLSEAKRISKEPNYNKREYSKYMNKYDVERDKARRAPEIASKRSKRKANVKRNITMTVKGAAGTAAVVGGAKGVEHIMRKHGKNVKIKPDVDKIKRTAKRMKNFAGYFY